MKGGDSGDSIIHDLKELGAITRHIQSLLHDDHAAPYISNQSLLILINPVNSFTLLQFNNGLLTPD